MEDWGFSEVQAWGEALQQFRKAKQGLGFELGSRVKGVGFRV